MTSEFVLDMLSSSLFWTCSAICPGAWQVLDSTWSTEKGCQGPPVVPAEWCRPHSSNESLARLQQRFPDRLISRRCDPQWSPHSPDLNPPDFLSVGIP